MAQLQIHTSQKREVVDITDEVAKLVPKESSGVVQVFVAHTTAALTTADLDPGTDLDLLDFLDEIVPQKEWRHPHDPQHAPDHLLASLIGPNASVPYRSGRLQFGTWQRVILIEFDGPRERNVIISILKSP